MYHIDDDTMSPIKNTAEILDDRTTSRLPIASAKYKEGCGLTAICHMLKMNPNAPATI